MKVFLFALSLLVFFMANPARSAEVIENFYSRIIIHTDGSLDVTETIRVKAENHLINRGIYRDLPTRYRDNFGNRYNATLTLLSVARDGLPEAYHTEMTSDGIRVYIGNRHDILDPGYYSYTLVYQTTHQLGFYANFDELYWNVTGNNWSFPILKASAEIQLPPGITPEDVDTDAYTGLQGSKGRNFEMQFLPQERILFETTKALSPEEGLTVAVSWPKGYVTEPELKQKLSKFLGDNKAILAGSAGDGS